MKKKMLRIFAVLLFANYFSNDVLALPVLPPNFYQQFAPCNIPLQDAISLNILMLKNTDDPLAMQTFISILQQYTAVRIDSTTDLSIVFKDNPYLASIFSGEIAYKTADKNFSGKGFFTQSDVGLINGSMVPTNGLPSPTTAIDAIGTFISTRFKEEINIAFLNKFRQEIGKDTNFKTLFPKTTTLLLTVEPYNYTSFLKSLSEDFNADFKSMPENLPELMKLRVPQANRTDAFYLFLVYADVLSSFENGATPPQIIDQISSDPYTDSLTNADLRSALKLTGLISRSIASRTPDRFWSLASQVQLLAQPFNSQLRLLFLGLIYAKETPLFTEITFGGQNLKTIVGTADALITKFCTYLTEIDKQFEATQQLLFTLKNKMASNITVEDVTRYALSFLKIAETSFTIQTWTGTALNDITTVRNKFLPVVYNVIYLWSAIDSKQYGTALTCVITFSKDFIPMDSVWKNNLTKYGTFMVNMINAKTSEDMVAALESAALPVGSYRIKRDSYANICLNAYAGISGGIDNRGKFHYGFTAPVGLAFSHGWNRPGMDTSKSKDGSSITLFFPIIDVGAVTLFRLQDNKSVLPEMAWQDIFSPGAYLIFGFHNSPLAFQVGTQYGPALRKIDDQTNAVIANPGWMFNVGLTVDLPVFNIYTRMDRK